jgi:hypothetical protein
MSLEIKLVTTGKMGIRGAATCVWLIVLNVVTLAAGLGVVVGLMVSMPFFLSLIVAVVFSCGSPLILCYICIKLSNADKTATYLSLRARVICIVSMLRLLVPTRDVLANYGLLQNVLVFRILYGGEKQSEFECVSKGVENDCIVT